MRRGFSTAVHLPKIITEASQQHRCQHQRHGQQWAEITRPKLVATKIAMLASSSAQGRRRFIAE